MVQSCNAAQRRHQTDKSGFPQCARSGLDSRAPLGQTRAMAIFFSIGTLLFAAFMAFRLLPKLVGLAFWLGSSAITGGSAFAILYLLSQGS
jgi:hypothetical protein